MQDFNFSARRSLRKAQSIPPWYGWLFSRMPDWLQPLARASWDDWVCQIKVAENIRYGDGQTWRWMLVRIWRGGSKYVMDFMTAAVSEWAGSGRKSAPTQKQLMSWNQSLTHLFISWPASTSISGHIHLLGSQPSQSDVVSHPNWLWLLAVANLGSERIVSRIRGDDVLLHAWIYDEK